MSFRAMPESRLALFLHRFHITFPRRVSSHVYVWTSILCDRIDCVVEKSAITPYTDNPDTALTTKWLMRLAILSTIRIVATLMHALGNKSYNVNASV